MGSGVSIAEKGTPGGLTNSLRVQRKNRLVQQNTLSSNGLALYVHPLLLFRSCYCSCCCGYSLLVVVVLGLTNTSNTLLFHQSVAHPLFFLAPPPSLCNRRTTHWQPGTPKPTSCSTNPVLNTFNASTANTSRQMCLCSCNPQTKHVSSKELPD